MRLSVLCPRQPSRLSTIDAYAVAVRSLGYEAIWTGQSFQLESHAALAGVAHRDTALGIGTALAALRTPFDAAMQARTLALQTTKRVSIGYGAADPDFVASIRGRQFQRPASHIAEYVRQVKELLKGGTVTSDFPGLESRGAQLPTIAGNIGPIEIGAGVLRAGMASRASGVADFVVTWLTPSNYIANVLVPALEERARPRIVAMVHVAIAHPQRNAYLLSQIACSNHLRKFHYSDMLNRAGVFNHPADIPSGARALVDQGVFIYSDARGVHEQLSAYTSAGVDEVVLNLTAVAGLYGDEAAIADLTEIATATHSPSIPDFAPLPESS